MLASWQALRGIKRECREVCADGSSIIMGVLQRLRLDAAALEARVHAGLHVEHRFDLAAGKSLRVVKLKLCPAYAQPPAVLDGGSGEALRPAATALCAAMKEYMMARLDNGNGPVNRATALLDQTTMVEVLERPYPTVIGPKCEKALLRMAVDWASKPWRSDAAILDVLSRISFVDVPTRTLLHQDEGSGWDKLMIAHNHQLKLKLLALVRRHPGVRELIEQALERQRAGDRSMHFARDYFSGMVPKFPNGAELHQLALEFVYEKEALEQRIRKLEAELKRKRAPEGKESPDAGSASEGGAVRSKKKRRVA